MAETDLHIVTRLRDLLPPLTKDERKQLKENILDDGKVLEAILWWFDGTKKVVIEGMHRWSILTAMDVEVPYRTQEMKFADYEEAELWILNHQLGRRNMTPLDMKRVAGELYNRLKRSDGGHGDQKSGGQNDPPILNTAEKVAEKAGISPKTVKRAGARVEAEAKLTKAAKVVADKATDAEVKALSQLSAGDQDQVARLVRTGDVDTIKEGMKGFKPPGPEKPEKPQNGKPPKQYDRSFWYKQWNTSIGPLVRLVDKIANEVGESKCNSQGVIQDHLNIATEEMADWMKVTK